MEPTDFQPNKYYTVFFEKQIPIEFKFLGIDASGNWVCQKENSETFFFNQLEQHLVIKEIDGNW